MKWLVLLPILLSLCGCRTEPKGTKTASAGYTPEMERIVVAPDGRGFVKAQSHEPFHAWGMNYGNAGRLMEDFWSSEWDTLAGDFHEMKALGANVAWYDALDETSRWAAQTEFWETVAAVCGSSPAVFCYDLINEPISPAQRRGPGKWSSGSLFGGYDFLQYIALDPAGRRREDIAVQWIQRMTAAIRRHDRHSLITVGLLPWSRDWKYLSGFLPAKLAPALDFISVHLYPDTKKPGEALESLRQFAVGKPVVIEETFPLSCNAAELETFLLASREVACGWLGHYDGAPLEELEALERGGKLTPAQGVYREWVRLFVRLKPEFDKADDVRVRP